MRGSLRTACTQQAADLHATIDGFGCAAKQAYAETLLIMLTKSELCAWFKK